MGGPETMISSIRASFERSPYLTAAGLLLALLVLKIVISYINEERKIRALGSHAPAHKSKLPFGFGLVYHMITATRRCEDYQFWQDHIVANANPERPWTIEARILGQRMVLTADEDNIKAILATQFQDYGKGPQMNKDWHDFLGDSIFVTDGKQWQDSRSLIRPQFVRERVSDLRIFEEHFQTMLPMMRSSDPVNLSSLLFRFTLDSATHFLLGESVDSLHDPQSKVFESFAQVQHIQSLIARAGPANFLIPRAHFHACLATVNSWIQPIIDRTLRLSPEQLNEKNTNDNDTYTFLHAVAAYTRDRTMIRDQIVAILLAGRDTTAATLAWLFLELARNPAVLARLRADILSTVGTHQTPTIAQLKGMRYLQHCLSETLRLYPIIPYNLRVALKDTTLPRGGGPSGMDPVGVLEGTIIGYSTATLQWRSDIYPDPTSEAAVKLPDHTAFCPERWETWHPKPWTYIPFNGGPRICVGQQFALTEMAYTVVRILQRFDSIEDCTVGVVKEKCDIVAQPDRDLMMLFREAKE